jgi:hypothetical protein
VINAVSLWGLVVLAQAGAASALLVSCAGIATPPVSSSVRTLSSSFIAASTQRQTAYSVQAILTEVVFIAGPLLAAMLIAIGSASLAVSVSAGFALAGGLGFVMGRPARHWRGTQPRLNRLGALASAGMRTLVGCTLHRWSPRRARRRHPGIR